MNIYEKAVGVQTRWSSFENPKAERGQGGSPQFRPERRLVQLLAAGRLVGNGILLPRIAGRTDPADTGRAPPSVELAQRRPSLGKE